MSYLSLSCRLLVWFFCFTWCQLVPEWLRSWEGSFNELDYPGWLELVLARNQCWEHSWGCTGLRVNVPRDPSRNYRLSRDPASETTQHPPSTIFYGSSKSQDKSRLKWRRIRHHLSMGGMMKSLQPSLFYHLVYLSK